MHIWGSWLREQELCHALMKRQILGMYNARHKHLLHARTCQALKILQAATGHVYTYKPSFQTLLKTRGAAHHSCRCQ
jgi:hypothetical protein